MNNSVYDSVFRILAQKTPWFFILLINEVFGTNYSRETKYEQLRNEFYEEGGKVVTDSIFKISKVLYHVECQSDNDGSMTIRMLGYDFYIAMEEAGKNKIVEKVELPKSCVLYLRCSKNTPDKHTIMICQDDRSMLYETKVIKLSDYYLDDLLEKKLLLLLPFYFLRFEKELSSKAGHDKAFKELINECIEIRRELENLNGRDITYSEWVDLRQAISKTTDYIFRNSNDAKKEVKEIMGGKLYVAASDQLLRKGRKEGLEKGIEQLIKASCSHGISKEDIIVDLMNGFGLTKEKAQSKYEEYSGPLV